MTTKLSYLYGIGRRKTTSARVRLYKGKSENLINGLPATQVFPGPILSSRITTPLEVTKTLGKYYFTARILGGGKTGWLGALTLGLSRALIIENPEFKPILRQHGFITRDPRERQRRMIGTGGKARRKKQSPKR